MSNPETLTSPMLGMRISSLKTRMEHARITEGEMKTFQRVAAVIEGGRGRIDGDDLIAASFVADTLTDTTRPE
ncbi:hypothetical protein [Mesorhizobium sp. ES1-4]|uniref:hypothetical protein n=1 Tax=Mesorhizobium sp. ES1-4 TaxID=2876627 RepID=UPI001CCC2D74|nr:hypothetical protein [Mesorhizobium sp. ES1-4]MBZ9795725.1 hypothetical protein [Mesorhizobium sp. ES1-4]